MIKLDTFSLIWNLSSVVATVVLHSVGTVIIVTERARMFAFVSRRNSKPLLGQFVIMAVVFQLLFLHLLEIGFWGICLRVLGLTDSLKSAVYFAGISYTSLGYSGPELSARIGLSEVVIAMVGLLMFGWSVGILLTTVLQYEKAAFGFDPTVFVPVNPGPE